MAEPVHPKLSRKATLVSVPDDESSISFEIFPQAAKMVEGFGRIVKYAMFVSNIVILIGGIVVFSVGVWTLADRSFMERLLGSDLYVTSAAILIATGVVVAVISFLGCLGALKEIKCMLLTFFIILFMIFITMLVGGILGYVFRSEVDERMHNEMLMTIKLYKNDTSVTDSWDAVQRNFKCCGIAMDNIQGYEIWAQQNSHFQLGRGPRVPESCCRSSEESLKKVCQSVRPTAQSTYFESCYDKMKEFVKGHALIVGAIGIAIACILVVGMVLSCALFLMIN